MGGLFGHLCLTWSTYFQVPLVDWDWGGLRGGYFGGVESMAWIPDQGATSQCCATLVRVWMEGNSTEAVGRGTFLASFPLRHLVRLGTLPKLISLDYQLVVSLRSSLVVLSCGELRLYPSCVYGEVWPHQHISSELMTPCVKQGLCKGQLPGFAAAICVGLNILSRERWT